MNYSNDMSTAVQNVAPAERCTGLVVAHIVEGCEGGVGTAVKQLITSQSLDEQIGDIHLLADPNRMGDMLLDAAATMHTYESSRSPAAIMRVAKRIEKMLEEIRPDVVYLHSTFPGVYGRITHLRTRAAWTVIYCAHGWAFTQQVSQSKKTFYSVIERSLLRATDAIISISFAEYQAALEARIDVPLHRVIYHGIESRKPAVPAPVKVSEDTLNIAFIGRFDRQKGLDILLEAFADIRLQSVTLWIIGVSTLGDCVQSIPDQPNIKVIGWVENKDIDDYIACFDAIVMPSRWEGFGLVALETMRNCKPIIASRIGGLAELVIDGVNGRLFQAGSVSALRNVLIDLTSADLARMGHMAGTIYETRFHTDRCYEAWKTITNDAVANSGAPNTQSDAPGVLVRSIRRTEAL